MRQLNFCTNLLKRNKVKYFINFKAAATDVRHVARNKLLRSLVYKNNFGLI